ncbi:hypothetical protein SAMN05216249_10135 [Acetitomaculum ruminis DSM 5522]|uniref:Lipoprotein n=1 Tax=Acetitomaculum ruminis DSM 5522 TaxID=1120918 RepID=A0A1I0UYM3_9FIRM|nr:hypothetical protein [Acetitomaculum ruminis]SFA68897.1 hypothetical protein SAMN05216249_10135 [Acetitomaculum ruminis DSM 5522]
MKDILKTVFLLVFGSLFVILGCGGILIAQDIEKLSVKIPAALLTVTLLALGLVMIVNGYSNSEFINERLRRKAGDYKNNNIFIKFEDDDTNKPVENQKNPENDTYNENTEKSDKSSN